MKTISVYCNNSYVIAAGSAYTRVLYTQFTNDFVFINYINQNYMLI